MIAEIEKKLKIEVETRVKFNPELLSPSEKMAILLRIFDLGSNLEQNDQRRKKFLDLAGAYHRSLISSKISRVGSEEEPTKTITNSDQYRKEMHDKIMSVLLNASLSRNIPPDQKVLLDYLARNRRAVEEIITVYFSPSESSRPTTPSQVFRGEGPFFKKLGDED